MKNSELTSRKNPKRTLIAYPVGRVKRGRPKDKGRKKLVCNITFLLSVEEFRNFELLRFAFGGTAPTRSSWARFLVVDGIERRRRKDLPGCVPKFHEEDVE
jgi:hypothetical protein